MMRIWRKRFGMVVVVIVPVIVCSVFLHLRARGQRLPDEDITVVTASPRISPDYSDTVIPWNIAPVNFRILEEGDSFRVAVRSDSAKPFVLYSRDGNVKFPQKKWKKMLAASRGGRVFFDVYAEMEGSWLRYETISNRVAEERIDPYLVYRFIMPTFNWWKNIGLYQRSMEGFETKAVLRGEDFSQGCINCHSFTNNSPGRMSIAMRSRHFGSASLLVNDGSVSKLNTKWGYTAWHPTGRIAAYSANKVRQFFHTTGVEVRDVVDLDSAILYYHVETGQVRTTPALSDKGRLETYPAWSPDGRYLYYCSAEIGWQDRDAVPPKDYDKIRYSLMRIPYDIDADEWGKPECVLSAEDTQKSILLPRVSPDGKFLVFCMCDYGCFPIYQPSSDLYVLNLESMEHRRLDRLNSPYSESWHSFSSNGRWMAFSSRRGGGVLTRTWLAYIDKDGNASTPFILPQKEGDYYDSLVYVYSVPELTVSPIEVSARKLAQAARSGERGQVALPISGATPQAESEDPWKQRE